MRDGWNIGALWENIMYEWCNAWIKALFLHLLIFKISGNLIGRWICAVQLHEGMFLTHTGFFLFKVTILIFLKCIIHASINSKCAILTLRSMLYMQAKSDTAWHLLTHPLAVEYRALKFRYTQLICMAFFLYYVFFTIGFAMFCIVSSRR